MKTRQLWFTGPRSVEIRETALPDPAPGFVQVRSLYSGISAGTEMLVYRGELPAGMDLDATLTTMKSTAWPLQYGYATVGRVERLGSNVDLVWQDRIVFAFVPHAGYFNAACESLVVLPESIEPIAGVFLANMETAVNLVLDGSPRLGEKVVVLGQGIVGLLTTALLSAYPLNTLAIIEQIEMRRRYAARLGARVIDPGNTSDLDQLKQDLGNGADLVYELTGVPSVLNMAIDICGYGSRIITGSWYGTRSAGLTLGGSFHRNRISLTSSQVSTIAPELTARWDKLRRFATAWDMIEKIRPETFITHRIAFTNAASAYALLDQSPEQALQVVLDHTD